MSGGVEAAVADDRLAALAVALIRERRGHGARSAIAHAQALFAKRRLPVTDAALALAADQAREAAKEVAESIARAESADASHERERANRASDVALHRRREAAMNLSIPLPDHLAAVPFQPTPFAWVDPSTLPTREWLYGTHLIRREISLTLAPGGVGKTSLLVAEALAMATGRRLLHDQAPRPLRVWLWNGEEPGDELARRVLAAGKHFGLRERHIAGRLFVDTGHEAPLVLAEQDGKGTRVLRPVIERLVRVLREREIDVMIVDPFISTHQVGENDTAAMQQAATAWKTVAYEGNVAIDLAHHTRKLGGQEATVDDGRGSSTLKDKARHARALSPMSADDAKHYGLEPGERFSYFAIGAGEKSNMAARSSRKTWYHLESVGLGNGALNKPQDHVAVVAPWTPAEVSRELDPVAVARLADLMGDGEWRASSQAQGWIGSIIAEAFGVEKAAGWEASIKPIIGALTAKRIIIKGTGQDSRRKPVPVYTLGPRETAEI